MNEAKKTLTMEFIESIMDENYTLVWVDYRESFDENRDLLQQCLEKQGCEDLWSKVEDWYEYNRQFQAYKICSQIGIFLFPNYF